jgi:hypothetical protein
MANTEDEKIIAMCERIEKNVKVLVKQHGEKFFDEFNFSMEMPFVCREATDTVIHFQATVTEGSLENVPTSVTKPKLLDALEDRFSDGFPDEVVVADGICQLNGVSRGNVHPCGYTIQGKLASGLRFEFPFGTPHDDGGLIIEGKCLLEIPFPHAVSQESARKIIARIREQKNYYDCGFFNVFGGRNMRRREREHGNETDA